MWKVVCTLLWSLIAGFSYNEIMLDVCRAMQGLGPAAFLPASMSLMGIINRSGPPNNLVFSIDGAMAPLGFFVGIFFAGVSAQYADGGGISGPELSFLQWPVRLDRLPHQVMLRRGGRGTLT